MEHVLRYRFFLRQQGEHEKFLDFFIDLRNLSVDCNFGSITNSIIRDQIIRGVNDDCLREKLLNQQDLGLNRAINICTCNIAESDNSTAQGSVDQQEVPVGQRSSSSENYLAQEKNNIDLGDTSKQKNKMHSNMQSKIKNNDSMANCLFCGEVHLSRKCPAFGKTCSYCKKQNHVAKTCIIRIQKLQSSAQDAFGQEPPTSKKLAEDECYEEGIKYWQTKNYNKAIVMLNKAIELNPKKCDYWYHLGLCYTDLDKHEIALINAEEIIQIDNTYIKTYSLISQCATVLDRLEYAISVIQQQTNISQHPEIKHELQELRKLDEQQSTITNLVNSHSYTEAKDTISEYLKIVPKSITCRLYQAECLFHLEDTAQAKHILTELKQDHRFSKIKVDVSKLSCLKDDAFENSKRYRAEAKSDCGKFQQESKQYKNAIQSFKEAIDLCPDEPKYWSSRAECYMVLENYNQAVLDCQQVIHLDPACIRAYRMLIKCYQFLGQLNAAEEALRKASYSHPELAEKLNQIQLLIRYELKIELLFKYKLYDQETLNTVEKYLAIFPESMKYMLYKAECLYNLGLRESAQEIIESLKKQNFAEFEKLSTIKTANFNCLHPPKKNARQAEKKTECIIQ